MKSERVLERTSVSGVGCNEMRCCLCLYERRRVSGVEWIEMRLHRLLLTHTRKINGKVEPLNPKP
jgi:hypothetical protein